MSISYRTNYICTYDDVIKWKQFPRYWPFVQGIHRWPVNSPHKGHWRGASVFSLICAWNNSRANNGDAGNFRCHGAHYDVILMHVSVHVYVCVLSKTLRPDNQNYYCYSFTKWILFPSVISTSGFVKLFNHQMTDEPYHLPEETRTLFMK